MALIRQPKSVDVPQEIRDWLTEHRKGFKTETAYTLDVGVTREVINRITMLGTCSPQSLKIVTRRFNRSPSTAAA